MFNYRTQFFLSFSELFILFILVACAESPTTTSNKPKVSAVLEEVGTEQSPPGAAGAPDNPLLRNITDKLQSLGYEALGLQFENDETLLLLGNIFDSPVTHDRQIRIIYTGLEMSYDSKHKSLTIGGSKNLASILNFIEKNIPKRDPNDQISKIPPVWSATPTTTDTSGVTTTSLDSAPPPTTVTTSTLAIPKKEVRNRSKISKKISQHKKSKIKNLGVKPQKKTVRAESKKVETIKPTMPPTTTIPATVPPTTLPPTTTPVTLPSTTAPSTTIQVPSSTVEPPPTTNQEDSESAMSQPEDSSPNVDQTQSPQTPETTEP